MDPKQLKYAETHEWVFVENGIATVGITSHAVDLLTDLTYIDLPAVGSKVGAGRPFGEVESVKATSDLYSPVDGEVIEVNTTLPDRLGVLNSDPYGEGWIIKVRVSSEESLKKLMDLDAYQQQIAGQG